MKAFELMAELSKMPAGAEVEFSCILTIPELIEGGVADNDGNDVFMSLETKLSKLRNVTMRTRFSSIDKAVRIC